MGLSDVNEVDTDGCTALHHACYEGHKEAVRVLMRERADMSIQDRTGRTAKDLSKTREITDILLSGKFKFEV